MPEDIKRLPASELPALAEKVRERILDVVSGNGGHLAASLGTVELTIALLRTFDPPTDKILWDVGHQSYAWKILTGRNDKFGSLRCHHGISGFPNPTESSCDAFVAGHAGSALAAAAGLAAARDRLGGGHVVAVVGDASLTNGESLEALNVCTLLTDKMIVVVNDNAMPPLKNVGALEALGLRCLGPVDGHDLNAMISALTVAKEDSRSVVVHVVTKKGKGFPPAETDPSAWHCVGPFNLKNAEGRSAQPFGTEMMSRTWSDTFGTAMVAAAKKDDRVCAVVAAMKDGTGLSAFAEAFPDRFFDVGICEELAVTFAAGLAKAGMKPVVAIYSTFLQRAIDQIQHDVCLQRLPVVFAIDRAGCVGADGATHHGLYDISLLRPLSGLRIVAPTCAEELETLLDEALAADGPTAIRYPKGTAPAWRDVADGGLHSLSLTPPAKNEVPRALGDEPQVTLCAVGDQVAKAIKVKEILAEKGIGAEVVPVRRVKPALVCADTTFEKSNHVGRLLVTLENGVVIGGFGESVRADLTFGWPDTVVGHGTVAELEREFGFDADTIAAAIVRRIGR